MFVGWKESKTFFACEESYREKVKLPYRGDWKLFYFIIVWKKKIKKKKEWLRSTHWARCVICRSGGLEHWASAFFFSLDILFFFPRARIGLVKKKVTRNIEKKAHGLRNARKNSEQSTSSTRGNDPPSHSEWCVLTTVPLCNTQRTMGLVRITSWYPNFNGSHFGLPPSQIHRMTGLPPKIVWTMTYSHRPHCSEAGFNMSYPNDTETHRGCICGCAKAPASTYNVIRTKRN